MWDGKGDITRLGDWQRESDEIEEADRRDSNWKKMKRLERLKKIHKRKLHFGGKAEVQARQKEESETGRASSIVKRRSNFLMPGTPEIVTICSPFLFFRESYAYKSYYLVQHFPWELEGDMFSYFWFCKRRGYNLIQK